MRRELKALQRRVNVTVIFVTHDQIEALSLSDRIAIMKFGVLELVGTPEEVYFRPATPFVRDFLGKTFLLPGKVSALSAQYVTVDVFGVAAAPLVLERRNVASSATGFPAVGLGVMVAIRPEQVNLSAERRDGQINRVEATLQSAQFLGDRYEYTVTLGSETRVLASPAAQNLSAGSSVFLDLKPESISIWPREP
jgi:ABC-type Fe3+/spermidine/putrescine transport system ATPase subunit